MASARIALLTILALIGSAVAGYIGVALAFFTAWEVMGITDRDGGGAMAVGFVFAPIGAVVCGLIGSVIAFRALRRRRILASAAQSEVAVAESALLLRLGAALLGCIIGWVAANGLRHILLYFVHRHVIFAVIFASTHLVLPALFAVIGFFLVGRRKQN